MTSHNMEWDMDIQAGMIPATIFHTVCATSILRKGINGLAQDCSNSIAKALKLL